MGVDHIAMSNQPFKLEGPRAEFATCVVPDHSNTDVSSSIEMHFGLV
jgi:hypothetical protein